MNRNAILNAMEKKAREVFDDDPEYEKDGKRGMMVVEIRDPKNPNQWDSSCRNFGVVFRDYGYEGELVINNGTNFDALVHGKIAFCRRTNLDSGTNYYQVLGYESFWKGGIISDDGDCICAYSGFRGEDDQAIARAGIRCYESLKRTGKSLVTGGDPDHEEYDKGDEDEPDENQMDGTDFDSENTENNSEENINDENDNHFEDETDDETEDDDASEVRYTRAIAAPVIRKQAKAAPAKASPIKKKTAAPTKKKTAKPASKTATKPKSRKKKA